MATKQAGRRRPASPTTRWASTQRPPQRFRRLRTVALRVLLLLVLGPPLVVGIYKFLPPPITILMIERLIHGHGMDHRWVSINQITPAMTRAVVASEDANFCNHNGFDLHAIDAALKHNEARPSKVRGGSTISQQTAKNVFLWPERSWLRKGAEAYFTVLIETVWGKRRIMEVYLNTVEMGPGVYGVEAASERYFAVTARDMSPAQASRLAAVLPDPLKWKVENPGPYVQRRTGKIDARSGTVARGGLAACVFEKPVIGGLLAGLFNETPSSGGDKSAPKTKIHAPGPEKPDEFLDPTPSYVVTVPVRPAAVAEPSVPPQSAVPTPARAPSTSSTTAVPAPEPQR